MSRSLSSSRIAEVAGHAVVMRGPDIDTDRIIPARFLKTVTFEGLEQHLFADDRAALQREGHTHPFDRAENAGAGILVVNKNFGCGSSREHAPQALYRWGIRAVVGESFSEIFFSNSLMLGLPCVTMTEAHVADLMATLEANSGATVLVDLAALTVTAADRQWPAALPVHARDAFISGQWDGAGLLLENYGEVEAAAARLPY
ncbi:MAG: 3-isopropylmalate dehydratase small subunit [Acidobacteria bacterium]|nr:3-isopropylmalate dehydratase small subunit [Acidobacteriota bacterium]